MMLFALVAWIGLILLAETWLPAVPVARDNWRRRARNILFGLSAIAASPLLLWGITTALGAVPPLVVAPLIIQLICLDLWTYGTHRAYHRIPLLWRFHAPHHLDETLDVTSALRFHVGEVALSALLRLVPAFALGISIETLLLFETILVGAAAFHHSNLTLPRWFEASVSRIIITPSVHWVHHHNIRRDTDANYGAILAIWDFIFGSCSPTRRWRDMPIGVENDRERTVLGLLAFPFAPHR